MKQIEWIEAKTLISKWKHVMSSSFQQAHNWFIILDKKKKYFVISFPWFLPLLSPLHSLAQASHCTGFCSLVHWFVQCIHWRRDDHTHRIWEENPIILAGTCNSQAALRSPWKTRDDWEVLLNAHTLVHQESASPESFPRKVACLPTAKFINTGSQLFAPCIAHSTVLLATTTRTWVSISTWSTTFHHHHHNSIPTFWLTAFEQKKTFHQNPTNNFNVIIRYKLWKYSHVFSWFAAIQTSTTKNPSSPIKSNSKWPHQRYCPCPNSTFGISRTRWTEARSKWNSVSPSWAVAEWVSGLHGGKHNGDYWGFLDSLLVFVLMQFPVSNCFCELSAKNSILVQFLSFFLVLSVFVDKTQIKTEKPEQSHYCRLFINQITVNAFYS